MTGFECFRHNDMEPVKQGMNHLPEDKLVRDYLLGKVSDETEMKLLEEKLFFDDDFADRLSMAEENLMEEFLDGVLTDDEVRSFNRNFLAAAERKDRFRLISDLRTYVEKNAPLPEAQAENDRAARGWSFRSLFPDLSYTVITLVLFGFGFGMWYFAFNRSNIDQGLAQLHSAYREQRSTESRITGFDYAPLIVTRGRSESNAEMRERAKHFLMLAATEKESPSSLNALGKYYLAEKDFERAIPPLERAAALSPENAQFHSDLGAGLLEKGRAALLEAEPAAAFGFLDRSLQHIETAIDLDPNLLEPRFNRAILFQLLNLPDRSRKAWEEYLSLDGSSRWSEEARQHLNALEPQQNKDRSADDLENEFLAAFKAREEGKAWGLLSANRELISQKYLPQRLAMSFLESSGSGRRDRLEALKYAGALESGRIGDFFARDIAQFYAGLHERDLPQLLQAQSDMRLGYEHCLASQFALALEAFSDARDGFARSGDPWETKLSEYFVAYCLINNGRAADGLVKLTEVLKFAQENKYKWLEATALYWRAGSLRSLTEYENSKRAFTAALEIARQIGDRYAIQRNLLELANFNSFVGQHRTALEYVKKALDEANEPESSRRQRYRTVSDATQILIYAKLPHLAAPFALQAVAVADRLDNHMFSVIARNNAGRALAANGDLVSARTLFNEAKAKAENIGDPVSHDKMVAYTLLQLGSVEERAGDFEAAATSSETAAGLYQTLEMPFNLYAAQKAKLSAYASLERNSELAEEIPATIRLFEAYRQKITSGSERTSFLDADHNIYDIAIEHSFNAGRPEDAYNYAERSVSRSLLDWLHKGSNGDIDGTAKLDDDTHPLALADVRRRMPEGIQIVQYTVLKRRLLIWVITKSKFEVASVTAESDYLRSKVDEFRKGIISGSYRDDESTHVLARELYDLLIGPIADDLDPSMRLCLVPGKFLFLLPFPTLLSPESELLLARFELSYAPSSNAFLASTERAQHFATGKPETLLAVGSPAFARDEFVGLPYLPDAEAEVREIARLYRTRAYYGAAATKQAFVNSVRDADVIHFAGHYVPVDGDPMSSYLLFAAAGADPDNGIFKNSELATVKLPRTRLIVLSACQSSVESFNNGEGLVGLSHTFLSAGVPLVVGSQWSVETKATAALMERFHFLRRVQHLSSAAALRQAQLEMAKQPDGAYRNPFFWAGFAVFGGYASF
jgi:CHAT domain-containing protein/tetratricopeptide (TPR) repeat protein